MKSYVEDRRHVMCDGRYLTAPGFCCPFGLFHHFSGGILKCLSQLSIEEVKAGWSCLESPILRGRFLPKFESAT